MSLHATRRGFMQSTVAFATAAATRPTFADAPGLGRVSVRGPDILDDAGRHISLRGAVTVTSSITSDEPNPPVHDIDLGDTDYAHMRSLGFSAQAIRLESCRMGATAECKTQDAYLEKLDRWVSAAEKVGIYTTFKMTTYDSPSWTWNRAFKPERWQEFWDNKDGQQDVFLAAWKLLWTHFRGRKSVVGYDILNEPNVGEHTPNLNRDQLFPFYRRASAALRRIDGDVALMFQPAPVLMRKNPNMRLEKLDDPHPLFTAHLYPLPLTTADADADQFENFAGEFNYAMLYGEYGYPDKAYVMPAWTPESEIVTANIFDRYGRGCQRCWYVHTPVWSLLNADGSDAPKMKYVARPYPVRAAGKPNGWSFDFTTRAFAVKLDAAPLKVTAPTEIYVARKQHYPGGLTVSLEGQAVATISADGAFSATDPLIAWRGDGEILSIPAQHKPVQIDLQPLV